MSWRHVGRNVLVGGVLLWPAADGRRWLRFSAAEPDRLPADTSSSKHVDARRRSGRRRRRRDLADPFGCEGTAGPQAGPPDCSSTTERASSRTSPQRGPAGQQLPERRGRRRRRRRPRHHRGEPGPRAAPPEQTETASPTSTAQLLQPAGDLDGISAEARFADIDGDDDLDIPRHRTPSSPMTPAAVRTASTSTTAPGSTPTRPRRACRRRIDQTGGLAVGDIDADGDPT